MKYDEMVKKAINMIDSNDDLFLNCVEALDSYGGFADGYKCLPMEELDNYYYNCKASQLINDLTSDFNINDDYFYFSIYGLESTSDIVDLYRSNTSAGELFDNLLKDWLYIQTVFNKKFDNLMNEICCSFED